MSPDPATLLGWAARFRSEALASRGTRGNPAYLPADVDLVQKLLVQAIDAFREHENEQGRTPYYAGEAAARFYAEHILGRHIDTERS